MKKDIEVPLTVGFDMHNVIGTARLHVSDFELEQLANGKLALAPASLIKQKGEDGYESQLVEIALVPAQSYAGYIINEGNV